MMRATCALLILRIASGQEALWEQQMWQAHILEEAGRYKEAKAIYQLVLQNADTSSNFAVYNATTWNNLALVDRNLGNFAEAREEYMHALALFELARSANSPEYATVLQNLG